MSAKSTTVGALPGPVRLVPLPGLPEVEPGMDLAALIRDAAQRAEIELASRIVVIAQKVVSKAEGRLVRLADVTPRDEAREIAAAHGRDPRQVELVLRESRRIVRRGHNVLITETRHGFVCANAGVDLSNAPARTSPSCSRRIPTPPRADSTRRCRHRPARPPSSSATPSADPGARVWSTSPSARRDSRRSATIAAPGIARGASCSSPSPRPPTSSPPPRAC